MAQIIHLDQTFDEGDTYTSRNVLVHTEDAKRYDYRFYIRSVWYEE